MPKGVEIMNLLHEELLNNQHHQRIKEATAVDPLPALPMHPAAWRGRLVESLQLLGHLRHVRIQVTFEVPKPCPER